MDDSNHQSSSPSPQSHAPPPDDPALAYTIRRRANALANSGRADEACDLLREKIEELSQTPHTSQFDTSSDELRDELRKLYQTIAARNNKRPVNLPPLASERALAMSSDRHTFSADGKDFDRLERELEEEQRQLGNNAKMTDDDSEAARVSTIEQANKVIDNLLDIFTCVICCKLLFQPVTTSCGHTFCRQCLCRAIEFTDTCPMCRTAMHIDSVADTSVNMSMQDAIESTYPELYAERRRETLRDSIDHIRSMRRLPVFPLDIVCFPSQKFPMHIFEHRYRLMLKRVMRGSRKFGIVHTAFDAANSDADNNDSVRIHTVGDLCKIGCVVEIMKTHILQDGRSLISLKALERFEIQSYSLLDEYIIADARIIHDDDASDHSSSSSSLQTTSSGDAPANDRAQYNDTKHLSLSQLESRARSLVQNLVARADELPIIQRALQRAGQVPPQIPPASKGPEALSLWIASLLVEDDERRQRLLEMCNSERRLRELMKELEKLKTSCERPVNRSVECRPQ